MTRGSVPSRLKIDFPVAAFTSAGAVLWQSLEVYARHFGFIARLTLVAFAPVKFLIFLSCYVAGVEPGGVVASLIRDGADGILGALVAPAVIYGMVGRFRSGPAPEIGECLGWGRRWWWKTLWNDFKADITIGLRLALLIVPGVIALVRLCFVDAIVAIEGDTQDAVLDRSREISDGHGWKIFFAILPAGVLGFLSEWAVFSLMSRFGLSWPVVASLDCVMAVVTQWSTVLALLMYLGLVSRPAFRG
jgi:hypothetical protein